MFPLWCYVVGPVIGIILLAFAIGGGIFLWHLASDYLPKLFDMIQPYLS